MIVIPAGQPQLRDGLPTASGEDRLAMCHRAIKELPGDLQTRIEVNPIEVDQDKPSYTIDTVEAIQQAHPSDHIALVVGTDAFAKIDRWHRAPELKKMVEFVVIDRPDHPGTPTHDIGAIKVSATAVRSGDSIDIPRSVATYIKEHNLYASK